MPTDKTKEQRIEQIQEWQAHETRLRHHKDIEFIDFLLSIVKEQEVGSVTAIAEAAMRRLDKSHEVITGSLDLRAAKQREGFRIWLEDAMAGVATSMRSLCVEKVKEVKREWIHKPVLTHTAIDQMIEQLESLTIQEQK